MENRIKVLVVDDKKIIGDFFDFTLGYFGHQIQVVHDATRAVQAARQGDFDIAFLDIMMPEMDGVEVLKELKQTKPDLPVVMMSGYSLQEKRDQAKELGAVDCLKKPFDLDDVRRVIAQALEKKID